MPLVLAHRGANKVAPQNTIPAFRKAIEFNADGLETDVHSIGLCCFAAIIIECSKYSQIDPRFKPWWLFRFYL